MTRTGYRSIAPMTSESLAKPLPNIHDLDIRDEKPREACPFCGSANFESQGYSWKSVAEGVASIHPVRGRYCSPARRLRFGFLWLRRCKRSGTHTHQYCRQCFMTWVTKSELG